MVGIVVDFNSVYILQSQISSFAASQLPNFVTPIIDYLQEKTLSPSYTRLVAIAKIANTASNISNVRQCIAANQLFRASLLQAISHPKTPNNDGYSSLSRRPPLCIRCIYEQRTSARAGPREYETIETNLEF